MMTGSPNAAQRLRTFVSRSRLDRELAAGGDPTETTERALRASQLVTPKSRLGLAASLQNVLDAAGEPARGYSAAAPLQRGEIRAARPALNELARRLREDRVVAAGGVAKARLLIIDGASPLYTPAPRGALGADAREAADGLAAFTRLGAVTRQAA